MMRYGPRPGSIAWRKSRHIMRIPAGDAATPEPEPEPGWSPLDIVGVDGYVDPRLGVTKDESDVISRIVEQVNDLDMECAFTNPDGIGGAGVGDNTPWRPSLEANAFGSLPGIRCAPNRVAVKAQFVRLAAPRHLASGMSYFWVSKFTENRTTANHASQNVPMTVVGESSHDIWNSTGFHGTQLAYNYFDTSPIGFSKTYYGSGYNDNVARLYGFTHSLAGEVKAYVDGEQVGSTLTGADYSVANFTWCAIGSGYASDAPPDIYGGDDGFAGLIGPVIVVGGVISAEDLASLYEWCQSEGWVP